MLNLDILLDTFKRLKILEEIIKNFSKIINNFNYVKNNIDNFNKSRNIMK